MAKKDFGTRIDTEVLDIAARLAVIERRSITSIIEIAVLDYNNRKATPVRVTLKALDTFFPNVIATSD
jgi:hypothetical protein